MNRTWKVRLFVYISLGAIAVILLSLGGCNTVAGFCDGVSADARGLQRAMSQDTHSQE